MMDSLCRIFLAGCFLVATVAPAYTQQATAAPETAGQQQGHAVDVSAGAQVSSQSMPSSDPQLPSSPIPVLTEEDRTAAFPDLAGHTVHDRSLNSFVLFDQFEWRTGGDRRNVSWDSIGWIGGDINRVWFRTEGDTERGRLEEAQAHLLYGRAVSRWWDFLAGVRQDFGPGPARTWAALGIQGLAPYFFDVEATAYIGAAGRTHVRLEAEYDLLITNRLILQPLGELEIFGKSDPQRRIGSGLSTAETGLRLRYEFRREFAPYVGVVWNRRFLGTADFARAAGHDVGETRFTTGIRIWF
jgi:copper resistance protein B